MTFTMHDRDSAPQGAKQLLDDANANYGFIPNLLGILAESPAALKTYLAIYEALGSARLSPIEQQVVFIAASAENNCHYCVAAHSTIANGQKIPAQVVAAVRAERPIPDPKLETLRSLTVKLVRNRGWLPKEDVDAFYTAGYENAHLLEIIVCVALKTMSNYTNHIVDTPVDQQFAGQAWSKGRKDA